jgi:hypothetical protein
MDMERNFEYGGLVYRNDINQSIDKLVLFPAFLLIIEGASTL